jgi:hypothetical protein
MGNSSFGFQAGGLYGPGGLPLNYGLFAQTGNSTPITNTITETTLIDGGVGTLSVPPNSFKVGDSFMFQMAGTISSVNNEDITFRIETNTTTQLATSGLLRLPQITAKSFILNLLFTIRAIGVAGTASIQTSGYLTYTKDASNAFEGTSLIDINNTTFDTTITNTLDVTAQWASASVSNSIYSQTFVLNKIF